MKGDKIRYRAGYKYQLVNDYKVQTTIYPEWLVEAEFIQLTSDGILIIRHGYAWDGPSGPCPDLSTTMRGSLIHDALYQLMRDGWIDKKWRKAADKELRRACVEDGMPEVEAEIIYRAVRLGGDSSATYGTDGDKPLMQAP